MNINEAENNINEMFAISRESNSVFYIDRDITKSELVLKKHKLKEMRLAFSKMNFKQRNEFEKMVCKKQHLPIITFKVQGSISFLDKLPDVVNIGKAENNNIIYKDSNNIKKVIKISKTRHDDDFYSVLKLMEDMCTVIINLDQNNKAGEYKIVVSFNIIAIAKNNNGKYKRIILQDFARGVSRRLLKENVTGNKSFENSWKHFIRENENMGRSDLVVLDINYSDAGFQKSRGDIDLTDNIFITKKNGIYNFTVIDLDVFNLERFVFKFDPKEHLRKKGFWGIINFFNIWVTNLARSFFVIPWQNYYVLKKQQEAFYYPDRAVDSGNIKFLYDSTYKKDGEKKVKQEIYDNIFSTIKKAKKFILIDMFLLDGFSNEDDEYYRDLSGKLAKLLIENKLKNKSIDIVFITDPINTFYGASESPLLNKMRDNGIKVIISENSLLRDSNVLYSLVWKMIASLEKYDLKKNKIKAFFMMLNFKANHRKLIIADNAGGEFTTIITSANPHNGSSRHDNVAIKIKGDFWEDVFSSEYYLAERFSRQIIRPNYIKKDSSINNDSSTIRLINNENIELNLVSEIDGLKEGDSLKMVMFYLSDRVVVEGLLRAATRGVKIKIILDMNKDAFGWKKIGIPNQPVAAELIKNGHKNIQIKWRATEGEQSHGKIIILNKNNEDVVFLGSANLTRRNISGFNLETDILLKNKQQSKTIVEINKYFLMLWNNENGIHSLKYEDHGSKSFFKYILYRFQERTGIGSF